MSASSISDLAAAYQTGGAKLINRALEDARQELGRQERNITPVDLAANEIYDILRKRLFKSLPDKAEIDDIAEPSAASWKRPPSPRPPAVAPRPSPTRSPPPIRSTRGSRTSLRCSRRTSSSSRPAA